jgi:hypothetical protein
VQQEYTLHLGDIRHLFNAPEFDPFTAHPRDTSGLDWILEELKTIPKPDSIKITLYLPAEQITPELHTQLHTAIQRYCEMKTEQAVQDLDALRRQGLRELGYGSLFLLICLGLAVFAQEASFLPEWLGGFLFNGFTVIGWVSLWHPTEILLFELTPSLREKQLYQLIAEMATEIKAG